MQSAKGWTMSMRQISRVTATTASSNSRDVWIGIQSKYSGAHHHTSSSSQHTHTSTPLSFKNKMMWGWENSTSSAFTALIRVIHIIPSISAIPLCYPFLLSCSSCSSCSSFCVQALLLSLSLLPRSSAIPLCSPNKRFIIHAKFALPSSLFALSLSLSHT